VIASRPDKLAIVPLATRARAESRAWRATASARGGRNSRAPPRADRSGGDAAGTSEMIERGSRYIDFLVYGASWAWIGS